MSKIWKLTLWKVSGVNDTHKHTLLCSFLSTKDFKERETLTFEPRHPNFLNATNNIIVLVLNICFRTSLRLTHIAFFNQSLWISRRTLLASLSNNFFSRDITKRGTAAWTTDSVSAWDELMSSGTMTLYSNILRKSVRGMWLTGY